MHRAVHRRAGAGEDADHLEGLVGVLGEADVAHAVIEDDRVAHPVAKPLRDFGAEHGVEQFGKWLTRCQGQRLRVGVTEVLEVGGGSAKDGKTVMGIAQRQRNRPGDGGIFGDGAVALPTDVVGRFADPEDGVEHQLHLSLIHI